MAKFYGQVTGHRSTATRTGTCNSGMKVSAQAWDGSVITRLWYNDKDELMVSIETSPYSEGWSGDRTLFSGKFDDLYKIELSKKEEE